MSGVSPPPVVLVHGFTSSFSRHWEHGGWVELLKDEGREVIGVDLLGHGAAPKPHDPAAYADLGQRVRDALPPEGAVDAIGFSLGGAVLLAVAGGQPERFRRLVVGGLGENVLRGGDSEPLARAIETGEAVEHPLGQAFTRFARGEGNDPLALAACLRGSTRSMTAEQLAGVTCPVLVVIGERDGNGPGEPLADALPDARLKTLRGVDHLGLAGAMGFMEAALGFLG